MVFYGFQFCVHEQRGTTTSSMLGWWLSPTIAADVSMVHSHDGSMVLEYLPIFFGDFWGFYVGKYGKAPWIRHAIVDPLSHGFKIFQASQKTTASSPMKWYAERISSGSRGWACFSFKLPVVLSFAPSSSPVTGTMPFLLAKYQHFFSAAPGIGNGL